VALNENGLNVPSIVPSKKKKLEASDLVYLFSMPTPEVMQELDEVTVVCKTCLAGWAVTLTVDHAIHRGTVNALLAHARSHQPGQPGMRRIT